MNPYFSVYFIFRLPPQVLRSQAGSSLVSTIYASSNVRTTLCEPKLRLRGIKQQFMGYSTAKPVVSPIASDFD
jgi:hypothetical protein